MALCYWKLWSLSECPAKLSLSAVSDKVRFVYFAMETRASGRVLADDHSLFNGLTQLPSKANEGHSGDHSQR